MHVLPAEIHYLPQPYASKSSRPTPRSPPLPLAALPSGPSPPPSPQVWSSCVAWLVHLLLAKALLRAMALPASVPWLELAAYTGYTFVPVCAAIVAGQLAGAWAYYAAWLYGSTAMAVFLVRTMKRVIFQEARGYGEWWVERGVWGASWEGAGGANGGENRVREVRLSPEGKPIRVRRLLAPFDG